MAVRRKAVVHGHVQGVGFRFAVARAGARGDGTSVYFRDPDGSLLEFLAYGS